MSEEVENTDQSQVVGGLPSSPESQLGNGQDDLKSAPAQHIETVAEVPVAAADAVAAAPVAAPAATPAAEAHAGATGVDWETVEGTGADGKILKSDVADAAAAAEGTEPAPEATEPLA